MRILSFIFHWPTGHFTEVLIQATCVFVIGLFLLFVNAFDLDNAHIILQFWLLSGSVVLKVFQVRGIDPNSYSYGWIVVFRWHIFPWVWLSLRETCLLKRGVSLRSHGHFLGAIVRVIRLMNNERSVWIVSLIKQLSFRWLDNFAVDPLVARVRMHGVKHIVVFVLLNRYLSCWVFVFLRLLNLM